GGGTGCEPGSGKVEDGSCLPAGVPPSACGPGFMAENEGCTPILPARACGPGQMAVPGETACHPVAVCGPAKYDGIPVDAATQYVDASFTGTGDGTEAAPWATIGDAIAAAPYGGTIAIAAGTYDEEVDLQFKPVKLWGVCPEKVAIAPSATDIMTRALTVRAKA